MSRVRLRGCVGLSGGWAGGSGTSPSRLRRKATRSDGGDCRDFLSHSRSVAKNFISTYTRGCSVKKVIRVKKSSPSPVSRCDTSILLSSRRRRCVNARARTLHAARHSRSIPQELQDSRLYSSARTRTEPPGALTARVGNKRPSAILRRAAPRCLRIAAFFTLGGRASATPRTRRDRASQG